MVSDFIRRIEKARREGEAKLKIIAPRYTPPPSKIPESIGGPKRYPKHYGGGGGSAPTQVTETPKAVPTTFVGPVQKTAPRKAPPTPKPDRRIKPKVTAKEFKQKIITRARKDLTPAQERAQQKYFSVKKDVAYVKGTGYSVEPKDRESFLKGFPQPTGAVRSKRDPDLISPALVKYGYDWAASKTLKAGGLLADVISPALVRTGLVSPTGVLLDPEKSPISGKQAKEIISSAYMFSSFAPFMKTGTAQVQESKYVYDVKKQKFIKKSQVKEYLEQPEIKRAGKKITIKGITFADKAARINKLLAAAKTTQQKRAVIKLAEETYGREFVKDFVSQEVFQLPGVISATPKVDIGGYIVAKPPTMPYIAAPETAVKATQELFKPTKTKSGKSLFNPSRVGETSWSTPRTVPKTRQDTVQDVFQKSRSGQKTIQKTKLGQDTLQLTKQKPEQRLTQPTRQVPKLKNPFARTTGAGRITGKAVKIAKPIPIIPILPRRRGVIPVIPKKQQGYIPQAKTKSGRWITLSKKAMNRSAALSRASRAVDQTLSAQFRIKKAKGKVTKARDSYFGVIKRKFRPYRISKGKRFELYDQFIEKRGSRIDTRGEKAGLKLAKYAKQMGWLATAKKKKK